MVEETEWCGSVAARRSRNGKAGEFGNTGRREDRESG